MPQKIILSKFDHPIDNWLGFRKSRQIIIMLATIIYNAIETFGHYLYDENSGNISHDVENSPSACQKWKDMWVSIEVSCKFVGILSVWMNSGKSTWEFLIFLQITTQICNLDLQSWTGIGWKLRNSRIFFCFG